MVCTRLERKGSIFKASKDGEEAWPFALHILEDFVASSSSTSSPDSAFQVTAAQRECSLHLFKSHKDSIRTMYPCISAPCKSQINQLPTLTG